MAISLTTDGLRLDYRTTVQSSVSGTYPIGTVIVTENNLNSLPGTWISVGDNSMGGICGSTVGYDSLAIRVK